MDNLKEILVKKVTGSTITSISSIASMGSLTSSIKGVLKGFSSANNLPPSMRGSLTGQFTQVGASIKSSITSSAMWKSVKASSAGKAIGKAWKSFKLSDIRLKENIQLVGKSPSGINIYRFKYKHTNGTYQGVMAQEVPEARQMTNTGFYMVDYSKLDVQFRRLN